MKEVLDTIQDLNEEQAKEVLFHILTKSYEEEALSLETFTGILESVHTAGSKIQDVTHVHIVTGESAAATLRHAFPNTKILCFPDNLGIGPLQNLENQEGWKARKEWLRLRIEDEHHFFNYESTWGTVISEMKDLPEHLSVYIWAGEHAGEYIGLQLAVTILAAKPNPLNVVHSSEIYRELFDSENRVTDSIHTAEMSIEQVKEIVTDETVQPLNVKEKEEILERWLELSRTSKMVRMMKEVTLQFHDEDVFDKYIMKAIREQGEADEFIKAARIVGEVYGEIANQAGDSFVEYRLLRLVMNGMLEIQGIPKSLLLYSVRL